MILSTPIRSVLFSHRFQRFLEALRRRPENPDQLSMSSEIGVERLKYDYSKMDNDYTKMNNGEAREKREIRRRRKNKRWPPETDRH